MNLNAPFGFVAVASEITPVPPENIAAGIQKELINIGGIKLSGEEICKNIPVSYFILTGGTEQKVWDLYSARDKTFSKEPVLLIAHNSNNSLPAALEILARFKQKGIDGKIIYADNSLSDANIAELLHRLFYLNVYHKLQNSKIGLIGEPSDWLIASSPDVKTVQAKWGPEVYKIDIEELISAAAERKETGIESLFKSFTGNAGSVEGPSPDDINCAMSVYPVLKNIINKYSLSAISVRCFDLVLDLKTTGCYALSKLNDDGIIAGCEGDLVSTVGMMWLNLFTGKQVWMANPARLDEANNSIWLAHCTVPLNMIEKYKILTHFESGLGVGIQGEFKYEDVTLLRIGGENLDKIWIAEGEIIQCGKDENLCRTQVQIKLKEGNKPSDLLNNPLGNHILMVQGSHAADLMEWWNIYINK